ncbi:MAG: hypothetical protein JW734_00545 [Candidatus Omnitrophica bacterium]|nr:hypothetical protein [Candidatus Omnitrophota bacterium]
MLGFASLIERKYRVFVCLFFIAYLFIGISICKDYGISWDEEATRQSGLAAFRYIVHKDQALLSHPLKYHGLVFEIFLVVVEKIFGLSNRPRQLYLCRHLLTFFIFYTGVIFFYYLCKYRFKTRKMALLGSLFLVLSPRIFAHSFYNSKDIPFLAVFIISIYTLCKFLDKKTGISAVLHALTCAILINLRIVGIFVPFITLLLFPGSLSDNGFKPIKGKGILVSLFLYLFFLVVLTVFFWPTLWPHPLHHIVQAFREMKQFPHSVTNLYMGDYVWTDNLPWHYGPVWIMISTPLFYLSCFLLGLFSLVMPIIKGPFRFYSDKRNDFLFMLWFFLPLAVIIGLKSTLYDGLRHIFFVYPALLLVSLIGIERFFDWVKGISSLILKRIIRTASVLIAVICLSSIAGFMIINHPYENIYFNRLAGSDMAQIKNRFELDYWGLSYKQALEYIVRNDSDPIIKIYVDNLPGRLNAYILPERDAKRLVYVDTPGEAKYFLSNFRWHVEDYPYKNEYYSVTVGSAKIMVVYKMS